MPIETNTPHATLTDREVAAEASRIIAEFATSYRNDDPDLPSHKDGSKIGSAPPVAQPDSRRIPAWATGIAVASIGIGTGATGIGCAFWLAMKGLSMATLNGVLLTAAPFAGVTVVVLAVGALLRSLRGIHTENHHHYNAPVHQRNQQSQTKGVWVKNTNQQ